MTMVSKYPLGKEIEKRMYEIFLKVLAGLDTSEKISGFLQEFLTPTERIMLAKRLSVALLLAKGYDYQTIGKILKVSPYLICDVNLNIKHKKGFLRQLVDSIIKQENNREFWDNIEPDFRKLVS